MQYACAILSFVARAAVQYSSTLYHNVVQYLGKTLKNQNSFQEEIKNRRMPGNASCYSVQNILLPVCYPKI